MIIRQSSSDSASHFPPTASIRKRQRARKRGDEAGTSAGGAGLKAGTPQHHLREGRGGRRQRRSGGEGEEEEETGYKPGISCPSLSLDAVPLLFKFTLGGYAPCLLHSPTPLLWGVGNPSSPHPGYQGGPGCGHANLGPFSLRPRQPRSLSLRPLPLPPPTMS